MAEELSNRRLVLLPQVASTTRLHRAIVVTGTLAMLVTRGQAQQVLAERELTESEFTLQESADLLVSPSVTDLNGLRALEAVE